MEVETDSPSTRRVDSMAEEEKESWKAIRASMWRSALLLEMPGGRFMIDRGWPWGVEARGSFRCVAGKSS